MRCILAQDDFNFVSSDDISKIITKSYSTKKTSRFIPAKVGKLANKEICKDLANCLEDSIEKKKFPNDLKVADITRIF